MQQGGDNQTVLSLRPGGGRGGGGGGGGGGNSRLLGNSSATSSAGTASFAFGSFSADLPLLRPHGGGTGSFALTVLKFISLCLDLTVIVVVFVFCLML